MLIFLIQVKRKKAQYRKKKCILNAAHSSVLDMQFFTESLNHLGYKRSMRSLSQTLTSHNPINQTMTLSATDSLFLNTSMAGDSTTSVVSPLQAYNPFHENNS